MQTLLQSRSLEQSILTAATRRASPFPGIPEKEFTGPKLSRDKTCACAGRHLVQGRSLSCGSSGGSGSGGSGSRLLTGVLLGLCAGDVVPLWGAGGGGLGPDTVLVLPGVGRGGWLTRLPHAVGRPGGVSAVQAASRYCQACTV